MCTTRELNVYVFSGCVSFFYQLFYFLEEHGLLDPGHVVMWFPWSRGQLRWRQFFELCRKLRSFVLLDLSFVLLLSIYVVKMSQTTKLTHDEFLAILDKKLEDKLGLISQVMDDLAESVKIY